MPFQVDDPDIDSGLDRLADAQPAPTSRTRMATAILRQAVNRFAETKDPMAWFIPALPSNGARGNRGPGHRESVTTQPSSQATTPASSDISRRATDAKAPAPAEADSKPLEDRTAD